MSTARPKSGSPDKNRLAEETIPPALTADPVLAQIPDLDPIATPKVSSKRGDGRIISKSLSIQLIFAAGLVFVVAAIMPFILGKGSRPSRVVTELPSWSSKGASGAVTGNSPQTMPPGWAPLPTASVMATVPPQTAPAPAPAILFPQPPKVGDTRPTNLTEPAWLPPRSVAAQGSATTPSPLRSNDIRSPLANTNQTDNRADYRSLERASQAGAPDARNLQADNRNDAAAQYRHDDMRYDYRGNPIDSPPVRHDAPPYGYSRDIRADNAGRNYPPAAGPGSPLMPSGVQGPTASFSDPQVPEPGVARFDGTIAAPPVRTNYDRAGSSNY